MLGRLGGASLLTGNRLRFTFSSWSRRTAKILAEIASSIHGLEPMVGADNRAFGQRTVTEEAVRVLFISGASALGEAYRRLRDGFDKVFFAGPSGMPAAVVNLDWSGFGERISRQVQAATARAARNAEEAARRAERHAERQARRWGRTPPPGPWDPGPKGFPTPPGAPKSEPVSEDERMAILKMLQEKKITAEQAEQLLQALEVGK